MEFPTLKLRQALVELGYEVRVSPGGLFLPVRGEKAVSGCHLARETTAWWCCVSHLLLNVPS